MGIVMKFNPVTGAARLDIQLGKIVDALSSTQNVNDATEFVRSAAVLNAPVRAGGGGGGLRASIRARVYQDGDMTVGEVYTNKQYAHYVELGTGRRGAMDHAGISPEVSPSYTMHPWWIHESQLDVGVADMYHWRYIDTPDGRFYKCDGQPAQPFLYPALKDNEKVVLDILKDGYQEAIRRASK